MTELTPFAFGEMIANYCAQDTSADPDGWEPENPLWGHCAVVALLVQEIFDGDLLRASLEGTSYAFMRSHYWNLLPGDRERDFTRDQFKAALPELVGEVKARTDVLAWPLTMTRYRRLRVRFVCGSHAPEKMLKKRCVIVESPYRGIDYAELEENIAYTVAAKRDCLLQNEAPFLSHVHYTDALDDKIPSERDLGIKAGLAWGERADASVVYIDRGISDGMKCGIRHAREHRREVEYRSLYGNPLPTEDPI